MMYLYFLLFCPGVKLGGRMKYPSLTNQNQSQGEVIIKSVACWSIRDRSQYFKTLKTNVKANQTWKEAAEYDFCRYLLF